MYGVMEYINDNYDAWLRTIHKDKTSAIMWGLKNCPGTYRKDKYDKGKLEEGDFVVMDIPIGIEIIYPF